MSLTFNSPTVSLIWQRNLDHLTKSFLLLLFLLLLALPPAMAFYPLNVRYNTRDVSRSKNPSGRMANVRPGVGPDGRPGGSFRFKGRSDSYIEFLNKGRLDARNSISILAWINPDGPVGPIFNYKPDGFGVHLWMVRRRVLLVRFVTRARKFTAAVQTNLIKPKAWNFVTATYNQRTGYARLYIDYREVARKRIGRIRLATNYPARMGARIGDKRYFRGRITCLQIYDVPLRPIQIQLAKRLCLKTSKDNELRVV